MTAAPQQGWTRNVWKGVHRKEAYIPELLRGVPGGELSQSGWVGGRLDLQLPLQLRYIVIVCHIACRTRLRLDSCNMVMTNSCLGWAYNTQQDLVVPVERTSDTKVEI